MGKRGNGEGSIRRHGRSWHARIMDGYKPDGKPNIRYFSGRTQAEVRAKLNKFKQQRDAGVAWEQYDFSTWADKWFEGHKESISPTTIEGYRYTLRLLKGHFGTTKIAEIRAIDIEEFLRKLRENGRADATLAKCRGMLFQIFRKAEANDLIRKNPMAVADKMCSNGPAKAKDAFTAEEVQRLMAQLPEDRIGWSIRLLLGTGMRTQELREQGGTYIWESPRKPGYPCNPSHFRDKFREALEAIPGVRLLTPHCCRHTYVSQMQAMGVDLAAIQSIVGHADLDMTRHYLHVQEPVRQAAAARFSEIFGAESE